MADYKINQDGEIIFDKNRKLPESPDPLWTEYTRLECEVLNNHHNPTRDPVKIARYNELKKLLHINDEESKKAVGKALEEAKEKIKREMIVQDESSDNSVLYTAITQFKKRNE